MTEGSVNDYYKEKLIVLVMEILPKRMKTRDITLETRLKDDLNIDSLKAVELLDLVEKTFGVDFFESDLKLNTVGGLLQSIVSRVGKNN